MKKLRSFEKPTVSTSSSQLCPHRLVECGSTISSLDATSSQTHSQVMHLWEAYSKGERNVGLKVYNDIVSNCPNYFIDMMKETNIAEQVNDRLDSDGNPDESDADEPSVGE